MGNFRNAIHERGEALGLLTLPYALTANNTAVPVFSYGSSGRPLAQLQLSSDNTTATNRVFTLASSSLVGHEVLLVFTAGSSFTCKLANTGNAKLTADWTPTQNQTLALVSDGTNWIELARSPVVAGEVALADGSILVGNGSGLAAAVAVSGDATLADTGALTIAAGAVTTGKIANNAVTLALLDSGVLAETAVTLTQANITGMSVTPVTLVAAPGAGKMLVVQDIEILHTYANAAYTGGGVVSIQYHGSTVLTESAATLVTVGSSQTWFQRPTLMDLDNSTGTGKGLLSSALANLAIEITNATAAFAAGDAANIFKVRIRYRVVTLQT